jgi:signal transduction histidine kinase
VNAATLLVIQGVDQGLRFRIGDQPVSIGRGARNPIRIVDTEVSRRHATIEPAAEGFLLTDLKSSNGTFVNGRPVRSHVLQSGDQIQLGRSVLLFSDTSVDDESRLIAHNVAIVGQPDASAIRGHVDEAAGRKLTRSDASEGAEELRQTLTNLQALYRISEEVVSPSASLEQALSRILKLTIDALEADRGCFLVADPSSGDMLPQVYATSQPDAAHEPMKVSRSIVDYVLDERQGVRTSDARSDERFETGQSILQAGIREAMCVPMQGRYELMGVAYVDTTTTPEEAVIRGSERFDEEKLRLLFAIGREAAMAIENHRYQQAFVKAERLAAVGQTIATLSHHIKNILQGIRGGSYLIDMGLRDHNEDVIGKGWSIVEKNQNKIYHLAMDMLTFSKDREPVMQTARVNDVVADVTELVMSRAEECQVRLKTTTTDDVPAAHFDPEAIHQAVLNVATNAIDAVEGREEASVSITTGFDAEHECVYVDVEDNGPGIPPEQIATIFNVFESTKGARGTGLGLAVSQKILREHGGEITIESSSEQGTRFRLAWPVGDDEPQLEGATGTQI